MPLRRTSQQTSRPPPSTQDSATEPPATLRPLHTEASERASVEQLSQPPTIRPLRTRLREEPFLLLKEFPEAEPSEEPQERLLWEVELWEPVKLLAKSVEVKLHRTLPARLQLLRLDAFKLIRFLFQ